MIANKKIYETIGEKIVGYESVARFYEKNREGRFQTKINLIRIADEIDAELKKTHTEDNSNRLYGLQNRIGKFI